MTMNDFDPGFHEPVNLNYHAWAGRRVVCDEMIPGLVFEVVMVRHGSSWMLHGPIEENGKPYDGPGLDTFWTFRWDSVHLEDDIEPKWLAE